MGGANTKYDSNIIKHDDAESALSPDRDRGKVRFYSKDNFQGNIYEIEQGNYTSNDFSPRISPDNVFSLTIPSQMYVKLYGGDIFDYGGRGFMYIENVTDHVMHVPTLPENIEGLVRSVSIGVHSDIQTWGGTGNMYRYDKTSNKPSNAPINTSSKVDDQFSIYTPSNNIEHFKTNHDSVCYDILLLSIIFILFTVVLKVYD